MRLLIQRVLQASVTVDKQIVGSIQNGLLVFLGCHLSDTQKHAQYLVEKLCNLRIFSDSNDKMNLSLLDTKGEVLVISQFTLYADTAKGRRPSFTQAAEPKKALELYEFFLDDLKKRIPKVEKGVFGAHMDVALINHGPGTFLLESEG